MSNDNDPQEAEPFLPPLVTPDPGDDEGAPQAPQKRFPWSTPKVPTKATLSEKRQYKRAHAKAPQADG